MSHADDAFFQVSKTPCPTSQGTIELPIAYYDTDQLLALFAVEADRVRAALAGKPLSLFTVGGKARVGLVFFEYRDTSIGPYNEVGLATLVLPEGTSRPLRGALDVLRAPRKRTVGFHVLHLPVTTAIANAAGRELWGYPKFVTQIDARLGAERFDGRVYDPQAPDVDILTLRGALPRSVPVPKIDLMLLSQRDHTLLRAVVDARGAHRGGGGGGLELRVGASTHPMAEQLRAFGLDRARPELTVYVRGGQSLLHLGTAVAV